MNFEEIKSLLAKEAQKLGITDYEIYSVTTAETSIGTLNREVNSFSSNTAGGICLRALVGGKMGYASTELYEEDEIRALVSRARENAEITEKLDTVGIFRGSDKYEKITCERESAADAASLRRIAVSLSDELWSHGESVRDGTSSTAASFSSTVRIANSAGLDVSSSSRATVFVAEAVVESDGESQAAYEIGEYLSDADVSLAAEKAVSAALSKIGARSVPTGKYDVIIDGKQMRSLLSVFVFAFSAKSVLRGLSLLAGKVGEKVASDVITVTDDPRREGYPIQSPFDAEGVATSKKCVIERGVLKTFLHNRETALAMNTETTANAKKAGYASPVGISPYVFTIEPGELSEDELLQKLDTGIYITEFKGLHAGANATTGDFSLESAGFMVEGGKKTYPVKSFTLSGNFFELLFGISALSDRVKLSAPTSDTAFGSPDVLVGDMSIAGK